MLLPTNALAPKSERFTSSERTNLGKTFPSVLLVLGRRSFPNLRSLPKRPPRLPLMEFLKPVLSQLPKPLLHSSSNQLTTTRPLSTSGTTSTMPTIALLFPPMLKRRKCRQGPASKFPSTAPHGITCLKSSESVPLLPFPRVLTGMRVGLILVVGEKMEEVEKEE